MLQDLCQWRYFNAELIAHECIGYFNHGGLKQIHTIVCWSREERGVVEGCTDRGKDTGTEIRVREEQIRHGIRVRPSYRWSSSSKSWWMHPAEDEAKRHKSRRPNSLAELISKVSKNAISRPLHIPFSNPFWNRNIMLGRKVWVQHSNSLPLC